MRNTSSNIVAFIVQIPGDSRAAGIAARRQAYGAGLIGLRVVSVSDQGFVGAGVRQYLVMLDVASSRVGDRVVAREGYPDARKRYPLGARVRTLADGHNHAGGQRQTMPAGTIGVISGRQAPNFRVVFPGLPGRGFLYAPQDLEPAT